MTDLLESPLPLAAVEGTVVTESLRGAPASTPRLITLRRTRGDRIFYGGASFERCCSCCRSWSRSDCSSRSRLRRRCGRLVLVPHHRRSGSPTAASSASLPSCRHCADRRWWRSRSHCRSRSARRCSSPKSRRSGSSRRWSPLVDLMAAVPSVVYGLWGLFLLQGQIIGLSRWLNTWFGWLPVLRSRGRRPEQPAVERHRVHARRRSSPASSWP